MQLLLLIRSAETLGAIAAGLQMAPYDRFDLWTAVSGRVAHERRAATHELVEAEEAEPLPLTGVEALGAGSAALYGDSRLMDGGDTLLVEPDAGGLLAFFGRALAPFELPFCCCCCCRHLARRFLNQTCRHDAA